MEVLRQPLPSEELRLSDSDSEWLITGPTFTYSVEKTTSAITASQVQSRGQELIAASSPAVVKLDDCRLVFDLASSRVLVLTQTTHQIVLRSRGDPARQGIAEVKVGGTTAPFFFDPAQGLVHGNVTFGSAPLQIEVLGSAASAHRLPEHIVSAAALAQVLNAQP